MLSDTYLTVKSFSSGSYKEKGSSFLAFVWPVFFQEETRLLIEQLRREHHSAIEIEFNKEKYIVVPQSAILLLLRDDGLFE